jgi:ubiquinone/menaquinone biosynthesis C-methylase UbiE
MKEHHVFPWWAGYFLISPFRKWSIKPEQILSKYISPGMKILDAGCAMGFFSVPMAELTGQRGKVFCIDPQKRMLKVLEKRAKKRELDEIIDTRECSFESLMTDDLTDQIDLALTFGVFHEVRDKKRFISEIISSLKNNGLLIFAEPHILSDNEFKEELELIKEGLIHEESFKKGKNKFAVLRKKK